MKLKLVTKVDIQNQDIYDIYIDDKGIEYLLNGTPIYKKPDIKVTDFPPLRKAVKLDIENQDIYDILVDSKGNEFTLDGYHIK